MDVNVKHPYRITNVAELPGHDDRTWQISWNPTKPLLASCSADKSVRLYTYSSHSDGIKFTLFNTISTEHTKTVRGLTWSPSGRTLATASFDSNIGIWEQEANEDNDGVERISEDGNLISEEWECATLLEGHETECKSVAYSCTGTMLASCSRDKTVWIWEVLPDSEFECVSVLMEHTQDVKCVAWHPTEEILASASYDDTIKLYIDDPSDDWFCFATLTGHTSTVWSISWSPTRSYLASASEDRTVRIWKRITERDWESVIVLPDHDRSVYSVSWGQGKGKSLDGGEYLGWIATAGGDGTIRVWELTDIKSPTSANEPPAYRLISTFTEAHGVHDINSVSWCPRKGYEELLATAGDDGMVKVWRVQDGVA